MEHHLLQLTESFFNRMDGPLHFRFYLQPLMAMILGVIDGYKDAKMGRPAYFWGLLFHTGHRQEFLRDGWKSIRKVVLLAILLDLIYQYLVLPVHHEIYFGELLFVTFFLAILPYLLMRGPVNRLLQLFMNGKNKRKHA